MRSIRLIFQIVAFLLVAGRAEAQPDTLHWDNNVPTVAFRYPDLYGDDLRNMRFQAPNKCLLVGALFAFPTRNFQQWTTGDPSLIVKVWPMGPDSLPVAGREWISDTTDFDSLRASVYSLDSAWHSTQFVFVDLTAYRLWIGWPFWFHIGYTAGRDSEDDSLAILSDNGFPAKPYASEWYNGHFVPMSDAWASVGLFIRAVVLQPSNDVSVLEPGGRPSAFSLPGAYPNPFNNSTRIVFTVAHTSAVTLTVYDLLGRERAVLLNGLLPAGGHEVMLDAAGWASGRYFIKLSDGDGVLTLPLVLEK